MIFPKWTNKLPFVVPTVLGVLVVSVALSLWYWGTDKHLVVGYKPVQPIKFSHVKHVKGLGMDCRYCHSQVERSPVAGVPSTETCLNCHSVVKNDSPEIEKLQGYHDANQPVPWVKVHKLPEYAYFDHSAHVNKGVSCVECHGRVDQMREVMQKKSLSMSFCLDCHRNPVTRVRDKSLVTNLGWKPADDNLDPIQYGKEIINKYHIKPRVDCSTCHR